MKKQHRALFLSHGGGPLPLLGDESHLEMVARLHDLAAAIARPSAIIVVSAHWEAARPAVTSAASPALIYDYYGFPKESYTITYPCPGAPQLAQAISQTLGDAGITADLEAARGFDHGLFVPLKIMYPEADIPCVQLSLVRGLDPAAHPSRATATHARNTCFPCMSAMVLRPPPVQVLMNSRFSTKNRACISGKSDAIA